MNRTLHTFVVGSLNFPPYNGWFEHSRRVFSPLGIAPTIHTIVGWKHIKILIEL
nr:MAG TPA: hypothetical protein [Caudoviricetes sp.]